MKNITSPMKMGAHTAMTRGFMTPQMRSNVATRYSNVPGARMLPVEATTKPTYFANVTYFFLWIVVFAMPWENAVVIPGFGTVSRVIGVAAFAAAVLSIAETRSVRVPALQHNIMALFVAWATLSYFWTFDLQRTRVNAITFIQLLLMVWLIWEFARTRKQQLLLLRAYVLGTVVSASSVIVAFLTGAGDAHNYGRYTGLGFNPNDLSLTLALSLPISMYLAVRDETLRGRVAIYSTHMAMALGAILISASRGPLLAASGLLILVPFVFALLKPMQKTVTATVASLLLIAVLFIVPKSSIARLSTIGQEVSSGTLNERTMIWGAGWTVFGQQPFGGVGTGAFAAAVEHNLGMGFTNADSTSNTHDVELVAHNTFVSVLVETGVIGLALFLSILLALALCAWKFPTLERAFWFSLLAVWLIGVSSLTWENRKPTWFLFGVLAAAGVQLPFASQDRKRKREGAEFWWRGQRLAAVPVPQYERRS